MKNFIPSLDDYLFESVTGIFVVKTGDAYQTLWSNSSPSVSYEATSQIFTNQKDALSYAQAQLKAKKTKTRVGQGGIPGGYSYTVVDLYQIEPDMKPENWTAPHQAQKDGAIKIELTSSGKLQEEAVKRFEEIRSLSTLENVDKIEPDTKDIQRADAIFSGKWSNSDKAITQLISIGDPIKLVRRMKAMLYAQIRAALDKKVYYSGYELNKGLDIWFKGFPWMYMSTNNFQNKYNARWDINLSFEDMQKLTGAVQTSVQNRIKQENPDLVK